MKPERLPPEFSALGAHELLVNETFLSIQGESTFAGRPCFFIRLAGCHLRCRWCDTKFAYFEGRRIDVNAGLDLAAASECELVEVTGGEPLLQPAARELMARLSDAGHTVLLETSGSVSIRDVDPRVHRVVDWKAPSSGMQASMLPSLLEDLRAGDELKLVLLDRQDFDWACGWLADAVRACPLLTREIPVHFSPVSGRGIEAELAGWILEKKLPVRLHLQLHKILWPDKTRGV